MKTLIEIAKKFPVLKNISQELRDLRFENSQLRHALAALSQMGEQTREQTPRPVPPVDPKAIQRPTSEDLKLKCYEFDQIPGRKQK